MTGCIREISDEAETVRPFYIASLDNSPENISKCITVGCVFSHHLALFVGSRIAAFRTLHVEPPGLPSFITIILHDRVDRTGGVAFSGNPDLFTVRSRLSQWMAPRLRPLLTPPNDGTQKKNKLNLRVALKTGAGQTVCRSVVKTRIRARGAPMRPPRTVTNPAKARTCQRMSVALLPSGVCVNSGNDEANSTSDQMANPIRAGENRRGSSRPQVS